MLEVETGTLSSKRSNLGATCGLQAPAAWHVASGVIATSYLAGDEKKKVSAWDACVLTMRDGNDECSTDLRRWKLFQIHGHDPLTMSRRRAVDREADYDLGMIRREP